MQRTNIYLEEEQLRALKHLAARPSWTDWERPGDSMSATLKNDPILDEIVKRLVKALKPERIYLFGSKARGDAGADSDYDLMVVVPQATEPGYRLAQRAHALLWDIGTAADILVWSQEAFDKRLHLKASLPATVVREGKLLYAA